VLGWERRYHLGHDLGRWNDPWLEADCTATAAVYSSVVFALGVKRTECIPWLRNATWQSLIFVSECPVCFALRYARYATRYRTLRYNNQLLTASIRNSPQKTALVCTALSHLPMLFLLKDNILRAKTNLPFYYQTLLSSCPIGCGA